MGLVTFYQPFTGLSMLTGLNGNMVVNRLTAVGEWYVPSNANTSQYGMYLVLYPHNDSLLSVLQQNSPAGQQYNAELYGILWRFAPGLSLIAAGFGAGTQTGTSSFGSAITSSTLGISITTNAYYRLTGWIEPVYNSQENNPVNFFNFGWRLDQISGPGGSVIQTLGEIAYCDVGYSNPESMTAPVPLRLTWLAPYNFYNNFQNYAQPPLSLNLYQSPAIFGSGYSSNPNPSDSFSNLILSYSPTFYYRLCEKYGLTAWDSSPNKNNGKISNQYGPISGYNMATGYDVYGFPGKIPGTSMVANVSNNGNLFGVYSPVKLPTNSSGVVQPFTVIIATYAFNWGNNNARLISTDHTDVTYNGFQLAYHAFGGSNVTIECDIGGGSSTNYAAAISTTALNNNTYYLIQASYTGSALNLFVNGTQIETATVSFSPTPGSNNVQMGLASGYNGGQFNGAFNDVALIPADLSSDASTIYNTWNSA